MNRDLIIGIVASAGLHAGFIFGIQGPGEEKPRVEVVQAKLEVVELPPPEPEDIPPTEVTTQSDAPADLAPPSLTDIPSAVALSEFTQQVQPPPPPGYERNSTAVTIPTAAPNFNASGIKVFDPSQLDQQPVAKVRIQPNYPFEMRRAGVHGEVVVGFICDSEGKVRDPYVIRSSQREFEAAALQAVSKWSFTPGRKGGRSVNTRMSVPVVFSLSE